MRRPFEEVCDVYVINTCTVTAESDRKSRQMIRRAHHKNPLAHIMVCGCYAQTTPGDIEKLPGVSYVVGTGGKMTIAARAEALLAAGAVGAAGAAGEPVCAVAALEGAAFEKMAITHAPRTRAYVKIEDGCECRCTYCAIPGARGPVRSKLPQDVIDEVTALAAGGSREIVLTGIETASYGADLGGIRLIDLLEELDGLPGMPRLRLGSLTPELLRPAFIERFSALRHLTPHLHLSVQSGSDAVLRGMRRRYTTGMVLEAMRALRAAIPAIQFTADVMVGFPGESDAHFEETMAFCREAAFLDIHVFAYSCRPGTPAATFPGQIAEAVKHERSAALIALKNEIREKILADLVAAGQPLSVLFETSEGGLCHGHAGTYVPVATAVAASSPCGEIHRVRPLSVQDGAILGEIIN